MVHQRDLDQAFMRSKVRVEDERGNPAAIELRPPGTALRTDRMVFGLAIGPLGLSSVLAAIQEIVETIVSEGARRVANVRVMDDYALIGDQASVEEYRDVLLEALELTGFEATKNWTWNSEEYTKWLGHYWKWNSGHGELHLKRNTVEIDPYHVTKRGAFEGAGVFHAVTESINKSLALAHANTGPTLAGRNDGFSTSRRRSSGPTRRTSWSR